jgi:hypothetical protein
MSDLKLEICVVSIPFRRFAIGATILNELSTGPDWSPYLGGCPLAESNSHDENNSFGASRVLLRCLPIPPTYPRPFSPFFLRVVLELFGAGRLMRPILNVDMRRASEVG